MILNLSNRKLQIRKSKSFFIGLKIVTGQNFSQPTFMGYLQPNLFSGARADAWARGPQTVSVALRRPWNDLHCRFKMDGLGQSHP
jgi:hypothetical protein